MKLFRNRTFTPYQTSQRIESDCHTIIFYNPGTNPFFVNVIQVLPGTQLEFKGQFDNETDQTTYQITFPNNFNTVNNLCVVIKEFLNSEC